MSIGTAPKITKAREIRDGLHNGFTLAQMQAEGVTKSDARERTGLHYGTISKWESDHGLKFNTGADAKVRANLSGSQRASYLAASADERSQSDGAFARASRRRQHIKRIAVKWALGEVPEKRLAAIAGRLSREERIDFADMATTARRDLSLGGVLWRVRVMSRTGQVIEHLVRSSSKADAIARAMRNAGMKEAIRAVPA